MKKLILFSALLTFSTSSVKSQIPVTDVAANSQLGIIQGTAAQNFLKNSAILNQTISSLTTLNNMKKTYDEWTDAIRTVHNVIASGKEVINIANRVDDVSNLYLNSIELIINEENLSVEEKDLYVLVFTKTLNETLSSFSSSLDITTTGIFEMNDSERLRFIRSIEKSINNDYSYMLYVYNKLNSAIRKSRGINASNELLQNTIEAVKN